jgi:hypothetical protein
MGICHSFFTCCTDRDPLPDCAEPLLEVPVESVESESDTASLEYQKSDSSSEPAWAGLGFPGRAQNSRSSGGTGEIPPGDLAE